MVVARLRELLGHPDARELPVRVRAAIREQQAESEILIGWVQLGILATFAILYAVSPKPYGAETRVAYEPWFLGAYFAFTLVRLRLAHRRRLPDWLLYASTVADMALLLALIWSFHVKYQQPPGFYLKAPTLLYVFIFIALRALRFEVRFVLLAGAVAAAGWLVLVWYAVSAPAIGSAITRDYVEYMTSTRILLGGEFDKVISILMVTAILAVAIARARRLLVRSIQEHLTAEDLSRFVPETVAERVAHADAPVRAGQGEVAEATVLFTDIEGFTAISEEESPTELIAILNEYFSVVSEPITRHGGVITQFQGDGILATFNVPKPLADHAAHAIAAALEIQRALSHHRFASGRRLGCRAGINTGTVIGGLVGSGHLLGYTVHGHEVNLAARLEQLNKRYGTRILVSRRTRDLAGPGRFAFRPLGEVAVRGRREPVTVYAVDAAREAPAAAGARRIGSGGASPGGTR